MKKGVGLIGGIVALLFLMNTAQATDLSKSEFESEMKPNKLQRSNHMENMANIRFDNLPVRHDSASLDSFIRAACSTFHIPGLATTAIKNGQVIWQQCYGYANLEDTIEVADTTIFTLASISKTITGTAIMQLWERGEFGLDDDINDYLPFNVCHYHYPDSAITFRMLMTHTSSIHDNESILDPLWVIGDSPIPLATFLYEYLVPGGIYYSTANFNSSVPGTQYDYSSVAIGLLGYLVEAIEDSFPVHCQDSIFDPLSMYECSWFLADLDTNNIARPYEWTGSSYNRTFWWGCPWYPGNQLRTSSVQLAQHLTAFMQYGIIDTVRILDSTTVELMTTPQYEVYPYQWMGLLWIYYNTGTRWIWGHNGAGDGIDTFMAFCPAESSAVIALTNCGEYGCSWTIAFAIFDYAQEYGVEEHESSKPLIFALQVSPNPFSKLTRISFGNVNKAKSVELKVYDATGRMVKEFKHVTNQQIFWNGTDDLNRKLPSGVYFLKFEAGEHSTTEKLLMIR